jgi:hypothetical protein
MSKIVPFPDKSRAESNFERHITIPLEMEDEIYVHFWGAGRRLVSIYIRQHPARVCDLPDGAWYDTITGPTDLGTGSGTGWQKTRWQRVLRKDAIHQRETLLFNRAQHRPLMPDEIDDCRALADEAQRHAIADGLLPTNHRYLDDRS